MPESVSIHDCWNKIGVWGKADCPELKKYVHCRNCPVYSAAAAQLLNVPTSPDYIEEWTGLIAQKREIKEPDTRSVMIFCLGMEWFALSTKMFKEVAESKAIHSLPHQRKGFVLGVVNIRGELLICVSVAEALGLGKTPETHSREKSLAHHRLLIVNDKGQRLVFPVDQVGGIHHFSRKEVKEVPATVSGATATYTTGMLSWQDKSVGLLDEQLLLYTLNKGLA